ncbi:hypothetical protein IT881_15250 [Erythrobacter sp. A30-3]|nr:hypothetical protein IT881_15250 [Erythrobacter sp. A30-3]
MGKLIVLSPAEIAGITASRGAATVSNLLKADPREVWRDTQAGSVVTLSIDLGTVQAINTVFLGHAAPLPDNTLWTITGGATGYTQTTLLAQRPMRVADPSSSRPDRSHGLWYGTAKQVRYLRIEILQPAGQSPIAVGSFLAGKAFQAQFNNEWGAGRGVIDTGRATRLQSGGFATIEGVRLGSYSWSFGDLDSEEVDELYDIQLQCGTTKPVLVVEDPTQSTGQFHRIHYSKFVSLKPYKRRSPAQTRWEMEVEQWG